MQYYLELLGKTWEIGTSHSALSLVVILFLEIEYTIHLVSKKSWEDARKTCQSKGGDLLSIADKKEQDLLLSNIKDHMKEYWIGLNDLAQEYKYVWSDGTPFSSTGTYKNWAQNEPKHNGRRCVQLWGKNIMKWDEMKWYGDICSKKKYFICEKHTGWWQLNN